MRWYGTVKLRTGIVVDNMMLYATGGLAYANFQRSATYFEDGPATTGVFSSNQTRLGWTTGVGTEWQMAGNWSLKSEALYMQFERDRSTVTGNGIIGAAATSYRLDSRDSAWITKIGLNYRFGPEAVIARY
jgi:outer membrane immunogenic protein